MAKKNQIMLGSEWPEHMLYKGELRDVKGERGIWQGGRYFGQSEPGDRFSIYDFAPRYAGIDWHFWMVELNNGCWLSSTFGCAYYDRQFPTREAALRCTVARLLRLARRRFRPVNNGLLQRRIHEAEFRAVVEWLHDILKKPASTLLIRSEAIGRSAPLALVPPPVKPQLVLFSE